METTLCAYCFDGLYYPPCEQCKGDGRLGDHLDCPKCEGSGNQAPIECPYCGGKGVVTLAYQHILSAARHVCCQESVPLGSLIEDLGHGVTQTSLTKYYHYRQLGFKAELAQGMVDDNDSHLVLLYGPNNRTLVFSGFCWGYGGEGPTGLMWILSDCGFFDSIEEARQFVTSKRMDKGWFTKRLQEA